MDIVKWAGEAISKPGIYEGVPIELYHSGKLCVGPSISSSGLRKIFSISEAHFHDTWALNPNRAPPAESEAFSLGRAVHHALLGEAFFTKIFVMQPATLRDPKTKEDLPWQGNRKVCKEWMKEAAAAGKTVLTANDLAKIQGMAVALGKEPLVRAGALNGEIECSMVWQDKETGVWLLARPDVIPTASGDFVDLKTTRSVLYKDISRSVSEYGYNQQGALIWEGYEAITGNKMSSFSLYFVESVRPYCSRLMTIDDGDLALGRQQNRNALRRFVDSMNSKEWPGPGGRQDAVQKVKMGDKAREWIATKLDKEGTDL